MEKNLLLLGKMAEAGYTRRSLAARIGITEYSLSKKISGKSDFNVREVIAICNVLHISDDAVKAQIFLT